MAICIILYPCVMIYPLTQTQLYLLVARIETPPGPLRSSLETSQTSQSLRQQNFTRLWNTNLPNHQHFRICGLSKFFEDPSDVRPGCRGFGSPGFALASDVHSQVAQTRYVCQTAAPRLVKGDLRCSR